MKQDRARGSHAPPGRAEQELERRRSQILGVVILAALLLALACIRYYFRTG